MRGEGEKNREERQRDDKMERVTLSTDQPGLYAFLTLSLALSLSHTHMARQRDG